MLILLYLAHAQSKYIILQEILSIGRNVFELFYIPLYISYLSDLQLVFELC